MTADKIRQLDDKELQLQAREIREQIFRLQFQIGMGQAEGLKKYRLLKKDQARLLSVIRERELAAASTAQAEKGN